MAAGNVIVYDSFKKFVGDGTINLATGAFKVALLANAYTPDLAAHTVFADLANEVAAANGYAAGGGALANTSWTESGHTTTFDADDLDFTAAGGAIGPFRKIAIYLNSTVNTHVKPLLGYCVLDASDITISDGNTLTVRWNAAGILTLSGAIA
jgi:hypothetical protein